MQQINAHRRIVITGSTRGIGFGLADAFLNRGCAVIVSGRDQQGVDAAVEALSQKHRRDQVCGQPCDVTKLDDVERLWEEARSALGAVDIWINNAGIGHAVLPLWELPPGRMKAVVDTNVVGALYGARVAIAGMLAQGHGQLYNMEGFGSSGRTRLGLSVYGASKASVTYLTRALVEETKDTPVQVGGISPGMVMTDLLLDQLRDDPETMDQARGIFNILANRVEEITPWIADRVLANDKHGAHIVYLTTPRIIWRFLTSPFRRRDVFADTTS
jgi:NAD(P)-dependent dehydrogenase (short-subunit alcohol dehydrogenase family)